MRHAAYKANLLQNAKYQLAQTGGYVRIKGMGDNRHVYLHAADGRSCMVWFPDTPRVHDVEVADLKEAIRELSGAMPFSL